MTAFTHVLDKPFLARLAQPRSEAPVGARSGRPAAGLPVAFSGISKDFGERQVLAGLDLAIKAGEFVAIVGRSGGGKSTLLRLLAGLDRPTAGAATLNGQAVSGPSPAARLMFQDARLLPWQSVINNVGVARGPDWRERAQAALDAVGLGDRVHDWPAVLSGGQRQRVALARALVSEPSVLLLDEPFGALDALTRVEMHQLLERLWRERGFTAVLITHDVGEAISLADRVVALREGAVSLDQPVDLARPRGPAQDAAIRALKAKILAEV